jgi:hypothetical protein
MDELKSRKKIQRRPVETSNGVSFRSIVEIGSSCNANKLGLLIRIVSLKPWCCLACPLLTFRESLLDRYMYCKGSDVMR